eukprot:s880_g34.t1
MASRRGSRSSSLAAVFFVCGLVAFVIAHRGHEAFGLKRQKVPEELPIEPPAPLPFYEEYPLSCGYGAGALLVLAVMWYCARRKSLRRPYRLPDLSPSKGGQVADAEAEFRRIVCFLQDELLIPIDKRMPGRPFEYDMHSFPFTPMVLVIGNHSSGKSTFINKLLGKEVQDTGVAPTDDGFTILERRTTSETEDGPTVLGCPENRPYAELQRFGQIFAGVLRRKRLILPQTSQMPFKLQIVDTPGMIDLPVNDNTLSESRGRGYNFVEVVRWWAKRADLILLLFDPDKPGTTGETLDVLTKALSGLGNDLESFLLEEVPAARVEVSADAEDEFGDIDWCDLGNANEEDFDAPAVDSNSASASACESNLEGAQKSQVQPKKEEGSAKPSTGGKEQNAKVRKEWKALREQAVARYRILVLSFIARLSWLNQMCNQELLQAAVLSLAPHILDEGVKLSLRKIKAQLAAKPSGSAVPMVPAVPSLLRLLAALRGGGSSMELLLLLVARCRSQHPARLVLSLPLPGAKKCGDLLRGEALPEPSLWVEIFDFTVERWRALGVPAGHTSHWIMAMGAEGDLWDVTGRYGRWSVILDARGSLVKVWNELLDGRQVDSKANELDRKWLQQLAEQEPVPTSRAQFKFHRLFVLDSQVRQDQQVDPDTKPVGLFQGKEAIWRRADVKDLCTVTRWRQQGRLVREDERPVKVLRRDSMYCSKLFGRWQTEELPEVKVVTVGGPIPGVNNYGNIEVTQGIPDGCVHVDDEAARMAAQKLGLEFAPAVISFRKERGQLKPVYSGCVVWSRDEAELRAAAEEERQRLEEVMRSKRRERLKNAWQLLVKNVLLDIYVESRNHKFLVILNKVDKLDNSIDFARAYGALGWALSKVIKRKDIPPIYTMFNEGMEAPAGHESLPLEKFVKKRAEVIKEVLRVRERHNDNVITSLEETLRQMQMTARIVDSVRWSARRSYWKVLVSVILSLGTPAYMLHRLVQLAADNINRKAAETAAQAAAAALASESKHRWRFFRHRHVEPDPILSEGADESPPFGFWVYFTVIALYFLFCSGVLKFFWDYYTQSQKELYLTVDSSFEEVYHEKFIHDEAEDLRYRWTVVRPKVLNILQATGFYPWLPSVAAWEHRRINEALQKDVFYLRQLARQLRQPAPVPSAEGTH